MSDENTAYYHAAGKSLAAILTWQERVKSVEKLRIAFVEKYGADNIYGVDRTGGESCVYGLKFKSDPPKPWRKKKGEFGEFWKPDQSKAGKAIADELKTLYRGGPGGDIGEWYMGEGRFWTPGFQLLGGDWIISHHEKAPPPTDAIPMKRSEFWALKESHGRIDPSGRGKS